MPPLYNFIINRPDSELEYYRNLDVNTSAHLFTKYDLEWCLQAYLILKDRGNISAVCNNHLMDDAINIVHSAQLFILGGGKPSQFLVCIQADFPHRPWAHYHIVQNRNQQYANTAVVPLWLQPGLIKRDSSRSGVKRVAYAGQIHGNMAGSKEMWSNLFKPHDIEFVTLPSGECSDLHDIDVLIGIRSFDTNPYDNKPPSKLINAWHSEIPFVGGHDSAFKQVGNPGQDYLLAGNPQEVLEAVLKLKTDAALYSKLVENGSKNAAMYTTETIAADWESILTKQVYPRYKQWLTGPIYENTKFRIMHAMGMSVQNCKILAKNILQSKGKILLPKKKVSLNINFL